eukprot:m.283538 g.283538  ORF g.283538 m.283538 type:complete len:89 (+) comp16338_c2_seq82:3028-3294(+)
MPFQLPELLSFYDNEVAHSLSKSVLWELKANVKCIPSSGKSLPGSEAFCSRPPPFRICPCVEAQSSKSMLFLSALFVYCLAYFKMLCK